MARTPKPLRGTRILSLALNLPGPAALMRLRDLGANCLKLEPPAGDPMQAYQAQAYAELHAGVRVRQTDLKSEAGRQLLRRELARADVLLTSFRPSALKRLGLDWPDLHRQHPRLNLICIVGAPGPLAETPGHDLTYMAEQDLLMGTSLPPTLFADMGGALLASEAVLRALMLRQQNGAGTRHEVALTEAVSWLALPRRWGLTLTDGAVGGAHAGYRVYACKDGRVALAALEPHFARALCAAVGIAGSDSATMLQASTHRSIATWLAGKTCQELDTLALQNDLPLTTLPAS